MLSKNFARAKNRDMPYTLNVKESHLDKFRMESTVNEIRNLGFPHSEFWLKRPYFNLTFARVEKSPDLE